MTSSGKVFAISSLMGFALALILYIRTVPIVKRSTAYNIVQHSKSIGYKFAATSPDSLRNVSFKMRYIDHVIKADNKQVINAIARGNYTDAAAATLYNVTKDFVHFENVCIRANTSMHPGLYPFQGRFTVYLNEAAAVRSKTVPLLVPFYVGLTKPRNNFWIFEFRNESLPRDWKMRNEIVVLPTYWMDVEQIFIFWYHTLPNIYIQLRETEKHYLLSTTEANPTKTLVVPRIRDMPPGFRKAVLHHGFASINNYTRLLNDDTPTCFRHVVAGGGIGDRYLPQRQVIDAVRNQAEMAFNLDKVVCSAYKVVLLKRLGTRKILNIDELATVIRQRRGFDVDVVSFEGMTIQQQLEILRCTSLFIAVQGAALAWMLFLPQNAMFVEIWFNGWKARYKQRAEKYRPDLRAKTVRCQRVSSEEVLQKYAQRWFNHSGSVTKRMGTKLYARSRRSPAARGHVFKDSDCACKNETILAALPTDDDDDFLKRFHMKTTST